MKRLRTVFGALLLTAVLTATAAQAADCCTPCCPPPTAVSFCVVDPCTCCSYTVTACLPACCCGQEPCLVDWKKGLFGRKKLTYRFPCGECVDVVITRHGAKVK